MHTSSNLSGHLGPIFYAGFSLAFLSYAVVVALIAALSFYTTPQADDFCYANKALTHGVFGAPIDEYLEWGGRYSSTFIMALLVMHWDFVGAYWLITILVMSSLAVGFFVFLSSILGRVRVSVLLTLPILVTSLIALPKPGETLFWMAGGVTYGLSSGVFLAWLGTLVFLLKDEGAFGVGRLLLVGLAIFLSLLLAGFQESLMLMTLAVAVLFVVASFAIKQHWSARMSFVVIALSCLIAGLVVVSAPGAVNRSDNHEFASSLLLTPAIQFVVLMVTFVLVLPSQLGSWISAVGFTALLGRISAPVRHRTIWFILVSTGLVLSAGALAPAWGLGAPPSPRAFTPLYFVGFVSAIYILVRLAPVLQNQAAKLQWSAKTRVRIIGVLLAFQGLSVLSSDFVGEAVTNLRIGGTTPAADYKAQWRERFEKIDLAHVAGEEQLELRALDVRPSLLSVSDPIAGGWESACFNSFVPIEQVLLSR